MIRKLKCTECTNTFRIEGTSSHLELMDNHILCWECDPKVQKELDKELGLIDASEAERVKKALRK